MNARMKEKDIANQEFEILFILSIELQDFFVKSVSKRTDRLF